MASDGIEKIVLKSGRVRYRFRLDFDRKPDGRRDQRTFTYDSKKVAIAERSRLIAERANGGAVVPSKLAVAQYLTGWLDAKALVRKPTTVRGYRDQLGLIIDRYGRLPLQKLGVEHLEQLKRDMLAGTARRIGPKGKPMAPRSVNMVLTVLTTALRAAVKRRLITVNPGELVDRVPADQEAGADRGAWQTEDAIRFLKAAREDRLYAAWLMSMFGLRRGEVLGVRWCDLDLIGELARDRKFPEGTPTLKIEHTRVFCGGAMVSSTPKTRAGRRTLPLPELLVSALNTLKAGQVAERLAAGEAYHNPDGLVVVDELGGPWRAERYGDTFQRLVRTAGVPRIPLHGARHCAATLLGDLGFPDVVVAAWLGHSKVNITQGYQHPLRARMSEAGKALGDALAG